MELFKNIPLKDNLIENVANLNECIYGIKECTKIIDFIENLAYISEVELNHLRFARESLYKLRALKVEITQHSLKFLN